MFKRYVTDKRISLLLLGTVFFSYTFVYMTKNCFSSAMVYIVDEGFMTKFQTGVITSVFWLAYAITQLFGGAIVDKHKPEHFITLGMIGSGIANLLIYFFYDNYTATLIIWVCNAIIQFGVWPAAFKIISTMLKEEHRKRGMVIAVIANPLGIMLSYTLVLFVSKWQYNFLISAVGLFVLSIAWIIVVSLTKSKVVEERDENLSPPATQKYAISPSNKISITAMIFSSGLIFSFIIAFVRNMIDQIKTLVPTMINESYDELSPSLATVMSLLVIFGCVCGPVFSHQLSKLFKNEYIATAVLIGATIPFVLVTFLIGYINYWIVIVALTIIIMLTSAASFFLTSLLPMRFNAFGRGTTVSGAINCFSALGNVAAGFILTLIAEKLGWLATLEFTLALIVVAVLCSLAASVIWKKFQRKIFNKGDIYYEHK